MDKDHLSEKSNSSKSKNSNHKSKKNGYLEMVSEPRKKKHKNYNEISSYEDNNTNSKSKKYKNHEVYEIPNNCVKEDYTRKEDKIKSKRINSKVKKNSSDSNFSEESKKSNKKFSKLRKIIRKINTINTMNLINDYYQKWILQTFDVIEEDSEADDQDKKNKEVEEEEEEEENDYGGDLEEIEERAADEEESVITSVQSKTKIKRANDIVFALRKIIKYKNIFFRYFMRWYNAVDINAPTNEYKKIRKEKKLSNNIATKKNANSNLNNYNSELKRPIYELTTEDELKSEVKVNLKNIIELKGNRKNILKKYYDIWYNLTFNYNNSTNSINNEQNEYIFTYHGNTNKNNDIKENNNYDNTMKGKETEGNINKTQKNKDNVKKENSNTQCYVKKKVPSMKKEKDNTGSESRKKNSKKRNRSIEMIKSIFIKVNNKKLLYTALMIWKKSIKKKGNKTKNKNSNSKSKKSNQLMKFISKESDSFTEEKEKEHRKNCFSIDGNINKNLNLQKIIAYGDDNQLLAESYQIISQNDANLYHLHSDNSMNSMNVISKSTNDVALIKEKESKESTSKKSKKLKKEDSKKSIKSIKSKDKKSESSPISQKSEPNEEEIEKIKKMVGKICRVHRNQRAQRYLLIKPPKKSRKTFQEKLIEGRQSFSTINHSLRFEKFQKKLYKLILKSTCRKEPLMYSFDIWFNKTFSSENYFPFLRKDHSSTIKVNRKVSKAKKSKKNKKSEDEISGDSIQKNEAAISSLKDSFNSLSQDNKKANLSLIVNSENKAAAKTQRESVKIPQIKDAINQSIDSESSDNKLLFNEKKKSARGETFDIPRKRSVGANKKNHKNKTENKPKKEKESKKNKEKNSKKENEARIEESPRQRKPGKKVQFDPEFNNEENPENIKPKKNYSNAGRDSVLILDNIDKALLSKMSQKKPDKSDLSASVDIVLKKKKKSNKDLSHSSHVRQKSKDDYNRNLNITEINDYFKNNSNEFSKEEDINPDVVNIEITQEDDSGDQKKHKKGKKSKNSGEKEKEKKEEKKEERRKTRLIKIYNKALHLLRKAIRSYKKRNKTFNPDYALANSFHLWALLTINDSNNNKDDKNNDDGDNKEKENENENENIEEKRIEALKEIINIINIHNKKIKGRLSEDEENYNYIKWCYNKWIQNMVKLRESEYTQRLIEKSKKSDPNMNNNNMNANTASEKESDKNDNTYDYKNQINKLNSFKIISDDNNSSLIEKKESINNESNKDKKNKKIESESLLEIELEDKKSHRHKTKKKKNNNRNYHSNINSLNNSARKEGSSKEDISKDLDIITKNIFKNIENNKIKIEKKEKSEDMIQNNNSNNEKMKNEESIFQRIRKEFPVGDECDTNLDYIKEKEIDEEQRKQEESGAPLKVQAPPQVMALMKKKGTFNLPLPKNTAPLTLREFGKAELEIVEPGELVSSERLKLVKKNLRRNFTSNSSSRVNNYKNEVEQNNATNNRNSFHFLSGKKYKEEIYPKLKNIFKKKDDGLFNKKKYFNLWSKHLQNFKKIEVNLNLPPMVKRTKYTPVIFLTKSLEDNNEEETSITNDNNNEENNMNKDVSKENIMKNENNSFAKNKVIEGKGNTKIINNKNNNNLENKEDNINKNNKLNYINKEKNNEEKVKKREEDEEEEEEENEEEKELIDDKNKKAINEAAQEKDEIKFLNKKETKLKPLIKESDNLRKIFNTTQKVNKAQTKIFNIMKYSPLINSNNNDFDYIANDYIKLLNDYNKKIKIYQLFMLYKMFNENDNYYIIRSAFNRWKKNNLIFVESNKGKHIKSYKDHCFSCKCEDEDKNYEGEKMCLKCNCDEIKRKLKNILIKHQFLKELNPIKYYLLLWYKSIFLSK